MNHIMADIYCAFNPAVEIRSSGWLINLSGYGSELTREELIAQGSLIRHRLENYMPDTMFRILKLFFTEPYDMQTSLLDIEIIKPLILVMTKIRGEIDENFISLCCLSEFWGTNLFLTDRFGPMARYTRNVSYEMLRRRRCRIRDSLEKLRKDSIEMAEILIYGNYEAMIKPL